MVRTFHIDTEARYSKPLITFLEYITRPENKCLRFWQALRNATEWQFIMVSDDITTADTFNWEDLNGRREES